MSSAIRFDPSDPQAFNHQSVSLNNGHVYHYVDETPKSSSYVRGTCLLLHGFPDLWYGWRYQIAALTNAGFRCIVPSCLGYGESSKPADLESYGFRALSQDLQGLLQAIDVDGKVYLFGHDWGGVLAWRFAAYYPQRVEAIAVISTPYAPPAQSSAHWVDLEELVRTRLPNFGYQLFFASEEAPALIQNNLAPFLGFIFAQADVSSLKGSSTDDHSDASWTRPGVLKRKLLKLEALRKSGELDETRNISTSAAFQYYLHMFQKHGIRHPLFWYKTRRICFHEEINSALPLKFPPGIPALFVTGSDDEALPLAMSERSSALFGEGQYQRIVLPGADHWLLQREGQRDEVASILCNWVLYSSREGSPASKL